jgi:hypothetical protein
MEYFTLFERLLDWWALKQQQLGQLVRQLQQLEQRQLARLAEHY